MGLFDNITSRDVIICAAGLLAGRLLCVYTDYRKSSDEASENLTEADDDNNSEQSSVGYEDEYDEPTTPIRDDYNITGGGRYKMVR
jgi:predicted histidine transporter YuiF (NhaC family)